MVSLNLMVTLYTPVCSRLKLQRQVIHLTFGGWGRVRTSLDMIAKSTVM
jgi:hypothetical protein